MGTRFRLLTLLILTVALFGAVAGAQETTTGAIEGTVTSNNGEALPGVTVTLSSDQGTKTAVTDGNGAFRFNYLIPGSYKIAASLQGFNTVEQTNVAVRLGSRIRTEVVLSPGVSETIDVIGSAPVVDLSSNTSGATISSELMRSVPVGRTFSDTLALAPGVVDGGIDKSNPSIGGASGLENTYVVDGVNIGNTGYGSAGSYSIVYGSLGTGVNFDYIEEVQVKTGGYEPEFGEALGGFINLVTKSGGNEIKGNGYAYYQPEWAEGSREEFDVVNATSDHSSRELTQSDIGLDLGGPLAADKAFAYGAFNPSWENFNRRTYHVTRDEQGIDNTLERKRKVYNYAGNLKWFANAKHTLSFSSFGDPSRGDSGGQRASSLALEDPTLRFSKISYGGHNVIGKWNGELMNNWFAEGSIAWHKDEFKENPEQNFPGGTDRRVPAGAAFITVGGLGFLGNSESSNTQYRVKFSNFFSAAGEHNLRYGFEYQDIKYDASTEYSGDAGAISLPDGRVSTTGFTYQIRPTEFRISRTRFNEDLFLQTTANYRAGFVSDSWNPIKAVNVMAGFRWERDELTGGGSGSANQVWSDNWGPRFHVTWDPTNDNKSKIGFSWGRFFGKIPSDLAFRALSTEVQATLRYTLDMVDLSDPNNPRLLPGAVPFFDSALGSEPTEIVADSKITFQDEWVLSAEREVIPFFNLGLNVSRRNLGRTLEDFALSSYSGILAGTEDFGHYIIGNPNESYPDLFPEPTRKYTAVTLRADKRMHDNWQMLASYTWARLKGNYEGFFRRDNGQSDPFITSLFDFPYLIDQDVWGDTIADGFLPNDRNHVFNLYGSYLWNDKLNIGIGLKVASGGPITELGYNEVYDNSSEIVLQPRGSAGRGDTVTTFNMHLDYPLSLGSGKMSLVFDVFNLFNGQGGTDYDNDFEIGCSVANTGPDCANPDFAKIVAFQDPRQLRFAARYSF